MSLTKREFWDEITAEQEAEFEAYEAAKYAEYLAETADERRAEAEADKAFDEMIQRRAEAEGVSFEQAEADFEAEQEFLADDVDDPRVVGYPEWSV